MEIRNCKYIFSKEEIAKIIAMYFKPESLSVIAKIMHIKSRNVIKKVLLENGVELRTKEEINTLNAQKVKESFQQKYDVDNIFQTEWVKEKAKQTKLERYGDENYHNQEKIKQTCLEKYGTTNGGWALEAQEKIKATNLSKFGVEWSQQAAEVKAKSIATCQTKYGVDYAMQTSEVQEKFEQTMLNKYGVRHYAQTEEFHHRSKCLYSFNNEQFESFPELAVYVFAIDHNISIKRVPTKLCYTFNDKEHYYLPDFEYNGHLLEIKGDQFLKEDGTWQCPFNHNDDALFEAKRQCAIENNVIIWYSQDYKFAIDYFNFHYNKEDYRVK